MCIYIYIYIYTHTYKDIYIYIYIYIYNCTRLYNYTCIIPDLHVRATFRPASSGPSGSPSVDLNTPSVLKYYILFRLINWLLFFILAIISINYLLFWLTHDNDLFDCRCNNLNRLGSYTSIRVDSPNTPVLVFVLIVIVVS